MRGMLSMHVVLGFVLIIVVSPCFSAEQSTPKEVHAYKYLQAVREFADNVLKYGRDTYGPKHTPLFVDGLNIHTYEPVKWKNNGEIWYLSNLASQQNLFRVLDALTTLTGDPKYRQAAVEAIEYAFENLQHENGLLYWGHVMAYDVKADQVRGDRTNGLVHSLKLDYPYYDLMWDVNPHATRRFIEAYWSAHILDWSNLDFNRMCFLNNVKLEEPWNYEYEGGPVFFTSKLPWGRGFFTTGTSLIHAGTTLYQLSKQEQPLIWSERLATRFVDTRHPKTGISAYQYNYSVPSLGDDLKEHFADPYTRVFPAAFEELRGIYYPKHQEGSHHTWISLLMVGEMLGDQGRQFTQWALEEFTAWGEVSYRKKDNSFVPILTDGTCLDGYVLKKNVSHLPKDVIAKPLFADLGFFWAYAMAYRATGDSFMWEMVRNIALGNGFGDIGETPLEMHTLRTDTTCSDVYGLLGFLKLYAKTRKPIFLNISCRIGDNILGKQFHKGFIVPSKQHVYTRFDCYEPLSMLHLQAAIQSYSCSIPEVWPSCPLFVPGYRHKESGNDRQIIYTLTESSEPFLSPQEAAAIGEVGLLRTLISNSNNINGWDDRFQKTALHRGVIGGHENAAELLISEGADINAGEITPLQLAIMNGHKDIAELLISEGADIDVKDDSGNTLLHLAAQKGLREVIGTLIAKNIDINAKNSNGQTPAHLAVQGRQQAIVKLLLEKGADITAKDNDGNTLLILACQGRRWAIAQDLVEAGAHVNQAGKDGQTPLHLAVARGPKDLIELLLNKGANVNARDEQGRTALHLVVPRGNRDLVELLLTHGADVNAQDKQAGTPALHALNVWKLDVVDLLIKSGADVTNPYLAAYTGNMSGIQNVLNSDSGVADYKGLTLLHTAAAGGQIELVNFLIGRGLDVKASTEDGLVPLHYAAMGNHQEVANILITHGAPVDSGEQTPLLVAADAGHKDMVKFLISKGADINKGPQTALHTEVDWWDIDAVKLLLELGADVNAQNDVGNTPLHAAVNTWWLEVAEVLLAQGAKIDMKNNQGQTPLLMAADDGFTQMVRLLVDKGANIHAKDNQGRTTLDIAIEQDNKEITQWLESKGAKSSEPGDGKNILHRSAANSTAKEFKAMFTQTLDISLRDAKDNNGFTPLHCAIQFWRTGNAKLLIDKGADLNVQDNEGYTPLHLAAWQGMKDMAELLIDRGANLNTQDNWGWTPLHRAVIAKQQDIAKLLIDEGADINIKDKEGRTALWWAEDLELEDTTELLKQTNQRKVEAATISKSKESKPVRGIAITAISAASTCKQGDTIPITVSLTNQGTRREAFHVTLAEDITGKEITSKELTLAKGWKDGSEGVADLIFNAESDETNYMGQRVCAEGDVNGDGYNDVLVTADGWNDNQGRAYLYYGGAELSSSPDKIFTGVSVGDHFGDASGDFGDVNNDNYDDVIIGARGHNANDGYVHIFYGGPDMDEIPDLTLLGEAGAGAYFGLIVSSGDVDGDDFDDVLVTGVGFDI